MRDKILASLFILLILCVYSQAQDATTAQETGSAVSVTWNPQTGVTADQVVKGIKDGKLKTFGDIPKETLYQALNKNPELLTEKVLLTGMTKPADWNPSMSTLVKRILSDASTDPKLLKDNPLMRTGLLSLFGMKEAEAAAGKGPGLTISQSDHPEFVLNTETTTKGKPDHVNSIALGKPLPTGTTILPNGKIRIPDVGTVKNGMIQIINGETYGLKGDATEIRLDRASTPSGSFWVPPSISFARSSPPKNLVLAQLEGLPEIKVNIKGASEYRSYSTLPFEIEVSGTVNHFSVEAQIIFDAGGLMRSTGYMSMRDNELYLDSSKGGTFPNLFTQGQSCGGVPNCIERTPDGGFRFSNINENQISIYTFKGTWGVKNFQFSQNSIKDGSSEVILQAQEMREGTAFGYVVLGGIKVNQKTWKINGDPTAVREQISLSIEGTGTSNLLRDGEVQSCSLSGCATRLRVSEYNTESLRKDASEFQKVVGNMRASEFQYVLVASESEKVFTESAGNANTDLLKHGVKSDRVKFIDSPTAEDVYKTIAEISGKNPAVPTVFAYWGHGDVSTGMTELASGKITTHIDPGRLAASFKGPAVVVQTSCGSGAAISAATSCASNPIAYLASSPKGLETVIPGGSYSFGNIILPPHSGVAAPASMQLAKNLEEARYAARQAKQNSLPVFKVILPAAHKPGQTKSD